MINKQLYCILFNRELLYPKQIIKKHDKYSKLPHSFMKAPILLSIEELKKKTINQLYLKF